jgi:hypothetical protein
MCTTAYIPSQMRGCFRSQVLLSLIFLLWTTATLPALSVGASGFGSVQAAAGRDLRPKLQYGGGGGIEMLVPLLSWLDLDFALAMSEHAGSDVSGGFVYAGFLGTGLSVGAQAHGGLADWEGIGVLEAGAGLGLGASLASYNDTTLYFFYPEVDLIGFMDFSPAFLPSLAFRLFVPLNVLLREDMDYTLSTGVGFGVLYSFGGGK